MSAGIVNHLMDSASNGGMLNELMETIDTWASEEPDALQWMLIACIERNDIKLFETIIALTMADERLRPYVHPIRLILFAVDSRRPTFIKCIFSVFEGIPFASAADQQDYTMCFMFGHVLASLAQDDGFMHTYAAVWSKVATFLKDGLLRAKNMDQDTLAAQIHPAMQRLDMLLAKSSSVTGACDPAKMVDMDVWAPRRHGRPDVTVDTAAHAICTGAA